MSQKSETVVLPEPRPIHWRVLGIDPGLQVTGYAVIEDEAGKPRICEAGVIRTTGPAVGSELSVRLRSLFSSLIEVIDQYPPQVMAVEQLYSHYAHLAALPSSWAMLAGLSFWRRQNGMCR